jgi:probable rRNA maturation factor
MSYDIDITREVEAPALDDARVVRLVSRALAVESVPDGAVVGVVFTDDATVHRLNREYRGVDRPTDVLSFGLSDLAVPAGEEAETDSDQFILPPASGEQLGDVIVSYDTAARQASEHGRAVEHELAHLIVHGTLHLLGHDHAEPAAERRMRAQEDEILTSRGFPPGTAGWSHAD